MSEGLAKIKECVAGLILDGIFNTTQLDCAPLPTVTELLLFRSIILLVLMLDTDK